MLLYTFKGPCMCVNASTHKTQKKSLSKVFSFAVAVVVGRFGLVSVWWTLIAFYFLQTSILCCPPFWQNAVRGMCASVCVFSSFLAVRSSECNEPNFRSPSLCMEIFFFRTQKLCERSGMCVCVWRVGKRSKKTPYTEKREINTMTAIKYDYTLFFSRSLAKCLTFRST